MRPQLEALDEREVPAQFGGVEFPQGASSFADEALFYRPAGSIFNVYKNPVQALGAPNYPAPDASTGHVTLGQGGQLGLRFADNLLENSGSTASDLWIFEVGSDVESSFISVRPTAATQAILGANLDADGFVAVGKIAGSTRGIDVDATFPNRPAGTLQFDAVKIVDDPNQGDGGGESPGADIDAVGAIASEGVAASVKITAPVSQASEQGPTAGSIRITRTGPIDQPLTVQLSYGGTATNGTDYQTLPTSVTIPANASSVRLALTPIDDTAVEGTETAVVTIAAAGSVPIDPSGKSATVQIADNDVGTTPALPVVSITTLDPNASESVAGATSTGAFLLERGSTNLANSLRVIMDVGGTAKFNVDYQVTVVGGSVSFDPTTSRLTIIMAGNTARAMVLVNPLNDQSDESPETVQLTLLPGTNRTVNDAKKTGTVTIADNPLAGL